jgi:hypothetical protein
MYADVVNTPFMLSVIKLNVIMISVAAPFLKPPNEVISMLLISDSTAFLLLTISQTTQVQIVLC